MSTERGWEQGLKRSIPQSSILRQKEDANVIQLTKHHYLIVVHGIEGWWWRVVEVDAVAGIIASNPNKESKSEHTKYYLTPRPSFAAMEDSQSISYRFTRHVGLVLKPFEGLGISNGEVFDIWTKGRQRMSGFCI